MSLKELTSSMLALKQLNSLEETVAELRADNKSLREDLRDVREKLTAPVQQSVTKEGGTETVTWEEFTNNTTLHGIRYMFTKGLIIRRILWFILVAIGVALFVYQVADRIVVFRERNTNVDVAVKYVPSIEFPSVTICNQNQFRITSAVDWGLYNFINDVFSKTNNTDPDEVSNRYNLSDVDTTTFVTTTAHQKEDLIHRCIWNGKPCHINQDFKTTLTDLGVCYTFNFNDTSVVVTEAGSIYALRLLLNIEQYEVMRGPQIEAGVKILLHNQGEVPQMKDRGFAVAPGTYTFVGVERVKVTNLPHPYGDCEEKHPVPVSNCQQLCVTKAVVKECGCRDVYMEQLDNETDDYHQQENTCNCTVPCKRVLYKPNLSYAQLSHQNIEGFVISSEEERVKLQFLEAVEATQRNVKEIADRNMKEMTEFLNASGKLQEGVEFVNNKTRGYSNWFTNYMGHIERYWNLFNIYIFRYDKLDIEDIINRKTTFFNRFRNINTNISLMYEANKEIGNLMGFYNNGAASRTVDFLRFCSNSSKDTESQSATREPEGFINKTSFPWFNVTSMDHCTDAFISFKNYFNAIISYMNFEYGESVNDLYEFSYLYTGRVYAEFYKGILCLNQVVEAVHIIDSYEEAESSSLGIIHSTSTTEALGYAIQILSLYEEFLVPKSTHEEMDKGLTDECGSFVDEALTYVTPGIIRTNFNNIELSIIKAEQLLIRWFEQFLDIFGGSLSPIDNILNRYITKNITKVELSETFNSAGVTELIKSLDYNNTDMKLIITQYKDELKVIRENLRNAYRDLVNYYFIDKYNVEELGYTYVARRVESPLSSESIFLHLRAVADEIANIIIDGPVKEIERRVEEPLDEMMSKIKIVEANLKEYEKSIQELNRTFFLDNFIQVNIFYQELSYDEIEQNIAFEFLSLLGEIGGFLGLLLGASVLIVFELVDFIALAAVNKFNGKQNSVGSYKA